MQYPQYKMGGGGANGAGIGEVPSLRRVFRKAGELYIPTEHWQFLACEDLVKSGNAQRIVIEEVQAVTADDIVAKRNELIEALNAKSFIELKQFAFSKGISVKPNWKKGNIVDAIIEQLDKG